MNPKSNHVQADSPPYLWAGAAALAVGFLYAVTLAPTTAFWDTSEYIATAHILGIPHPPGNPLFVVLARSWELFLGVFGLSTAVRINLFSALMGALAHGLWFLTLHHILGHFSERRSFRLIGAAAATLVSATAFTVWNQSNVNEKVYTVSLFTIALLSWLAFRWRERQGHPRNDNLIVLMAFVLALSVGNHLMAFLAAPALLVFVFLISPKTLFNPRILSLGVAAAVVGLSIHLMLPVRSELNPIINEGAPTCEGTGDALVSIVTYGVAGCDQLSAALQREQYDKPPLLPRQASLMSQASNWLQYFDWQWARGLSPDRVLFGPARLPVTLLFIALGAIGFLEHYRRDRMSWAYMMTLFGVLSAGLVFYLNFRYGFAFGERMPPGAGQEVRERDYFFIVGFSVWGLMAGLGIATLWQWAARRTGLGLAKAAPVLALALIPLVMNYDRADRSSDYSARDWAYNLLMSVEPYSLLITNGDNDTFPLWYLQEVEGIRRDVTVAVTSYMNTDWYVKQLRELTRPCEPGEDPDADPATILCQRPYVTDNVDVVYAHDPADPDAWQRAPAGPDAEGRVVIPVAEPVRKPSRSIFPDNLTDETIEAVMRSTRRLEAPRRVDLGPATATLSGSYLFPWHQFLLVAIQNSLPDRPVYFATSGTASSQFGLRSNVVRQGLAFRLWPGDLAGTVSNPADPAYGGIWRNTENTPFAGVVGEWVDAWRSRLLADHVYVHRTGIPDEWGYWPDWSTLGIPNYYAWVYFALAREAVNRGADGEGQAYWARFEEWNRLGARPAVESETAEE